MGKSHSESVDLAQISIPTPFVQRLVLTGAALTIVLAFIVLPVFAGWSKAGIGVRFVLLALFAIEGAISLWLIWHGLSSQVILTGKARITVSRRLGPFSTRQTIEDVDAIELDRKLTGSGRGAYLAETLSIRAGGRTHLLHTLPASRYEVGSLEELALRIASGSEVAFVDRRSSDLI